MKEGSKVSLCLINYLVDSNQCKIETFSATAHAYVNGEIWFLFDKTRLNCWSVAESVFCEVVAKDDMLFSFCLNEKSSISKAKTNMINFLENKLNKLEQQINLCKIAQKEIASAEN